MNLWLLAITLFISGIVTDFMWAIYIQKLSECKRTQDSLKRKLLLREAAFWSVGIGLCSIFLVEGIIVNFYVSLIWLVGLWLGTYYSNTFESFFRKLFGQYI